MGLGGCDVMNAAFTLRRNLESSQPGKRNERQKCEVSQCFLKSIFNFEGRKGTDALLHPTVVV